MITLLNILFCLHEIKFFLGTLGGNDEVVKMIRLFTDFFLPSRFWTRCVLGARGSAKLNWVYRLCWICRKASKFPNRMSHSHWAFTHGILHSFAFSYFSPLGLEYTHTHTPWLVSQAQKRSFILPWTLYTVIKMHQFYETYKLSNFILLLLIIIIYHDRDTVNPTECASIGKQKRIRTII